MTPLVNHPYVTGQRWNNGTYTLYVLAVNEDLKDEDGVPCEPGKICVTDQKPFPGKKMTATDLSPDQFDGVIQKGNYKKMDEDWTAEFSIAKEAQLAAEKAAGLKPPKPVKPPQVHGLGAMMMK